MGHGSRPRNRDGSPYFNVLKNDSTKALSPGALDMLIWKPCVRKILVNPENGRVRDRPRDETFVAREWRSGSGRTPGSDVKRGWSVVWRKLLIGFNPYRFITRRSRFVLTKFPIHPAPWKFGLDPLRSAKGCCSKRALGPSFRKIPADYGIEFRERDDRPTKRRRTRLTDVFRLLPRCRVSVIWPVSICSTRVIRRS